MNERVDDWPKKVTRSPRGQVTAAIPLGEFGTAEQVADAFAFLCGAASNYMTGSVLLVDGGCSLVKRQ